MKLSCLLVAVVFSILSADSNACPFRQSSNAVPEDEIHSNLRSRRRILSSLREDDETRKSISDIIENRSLQTSQNCVSSTIYNNIRTDIVSISAAINDPGDRGHFFGGIVRLAAHDFMDYDRSAETDPNSEALGPDGCIDFTHQANAGLPFLWCDNPVDCPLKALYDTSYSFISKADFWVAAANAVIQATSIPSTPGRPDGLVLPFRWGRVDSDTCGESSARIPEPEGCAVVERTFIDRMGLSWRDAVALLGAHTLGRGNAEFSGHDGTWVDSDEESTIFDKRFYEEALRRAWRPRQTAVGVNWTWGGNNRGVMMLNTDICLVFDIPEGNAQDCCTDITGNCNNNFENNQCPLADTVRPEAFNAFNEFIGGQNLNNDNNEPFYSAFSIAWQLATELGYSDNELFDVPETCGPTSAPVPFSPHPTSINFVRPSSSPSESCTDVEFIETRGGGGTKTCAQIASNDNCVKWGHLCPVTCGVCDCLTEDMVCSSNDDCCTGLDCNNRGRCTPTSRITPAPSTTPSFAPTESPFCPNQDILGRTIYAPSAAANACFQIEVFPGGSLTADFTDHTCSNPVFSGTSVLSSFDDFVGPQAGWIPGAGTHSGTMQFVESSSESEATTVLLAYDTVNLVFGLEIRLPTCTASVSPSIAPTESPFCPNQDILGRTIYAPSAAADACFQIEVFPGGSLTADFTDPTCSNAVFSGTSLFSSFFGFSGPQAGWIPSAGTHSGTMQFVESSSESEATIAVLAYDTVNLVFGLEIRLPTCTASV